MRNSICAFILLFSLGLSANEPIRTWTDAQGRKIQAKLINFSEDKVTLEMNGKEFALPLSLFSETDQKYVTQVNLSSPTSDESISQIKMIQVMENRILALEKEKVARIKEHEEFIEVMRLESKRIITELQNEIRRAEAEGYKRGIAEMKAKYEKSSTSTSPQVPSMSIAEKLERIEIPRVDFFQSPLSDAIMELQRLSRQFDKTTGDSEEKGVRFVVKPTLGKQPTVNITLNKMSLAHMVKFVCQMVKWDYEISDTTVLIKPHTLVTEKFSFDHQLIGLMKNEINEKKQPKKYNPNYDPFSSRANAKLATGGDDDSVLKSFFSYIGVEFDESKGHKFNIEGSFITITHSTLHMSRISECFALLEEEKKQK